MRSRFTRLGTVAVGLVALLGGIVPPAPANTVMETVFTATANLSGPLGYPCTGPGSLPGGTGWTQDLGLCPITTTPRLVTDLPLNTPIGNENLTNFHIDWNHNTRGVSIASSLCVDVGVNILKPKPAAQAGLCSFTTAAGALPNTVSGYCGLAGGQITIRLVDDLGQVIIIDLHFVIFDSTIVFTGHWTKVTGGQHGLVVGKGYIIPPISVLSVTLTPGSCLGKTATTFTIAGEATLVSSPL